VNCIRIHVCNVCFGLFHLLLLLLLLVYKAPDMFFHCTTPVLLVHGQGSGQDRPNPVRANRLLLKKHPSYAVIKELGVQDTCETSRLDSSALLQHTAPSLFVPFTSGVPTRGQTPRAVFTSAAEPRSPPASLNYFSNQSMLGSPAPQWLPPSVTFPSTESDRAKPHVEKN